MANLEWNGGVCPAEPGLPNLLLLSLERVRVRDPPEYIYREYEHYGTILCKVLIFVGRSTVYPDIDYWFISTTGFRFPDAYPKAARRPYDAYERFIGNTSNRLQWDFSHPQEVENAHGSTELGDWKENLSIYLNGLDHLYRDQAEQLKHQIDRAERSEQRIELERVKTRMAEVALANLEQDYAREREHTLIANKALWNEVHKERRRREEAGLMEDEPEKTHWDKGTQTEDVILEQDLPPKKRHIQTEEESP
jgi:hypothetical protein